MNQEPKLHEAARAALDPMSTTVELTPEALADVRGGMSLVPRALQRILEQRGQAKTLIGELAAEDNQQLREVIANLR